MARLREVGIFYRPGKGPPLDSFYDLREKIFNATNSVSSRYKQVDIGVVQDDMWVTPGFIVTAKERQPGALEEPLKEYLSIAGHPYFISELSDFDAMKSVLPQEKMLKRSWRSLWMGKYVVDAK